MSGSSGSETGAARLAKEEDENRRCSNCGHTRRSHTTSGCSICNCSAFQN